MNYDEFIHISGESYNDISVEQYHNEIEPAYMALPDSFLKSKEDFCKWWSRNRELCKFISKQNKTVYELGKQVSSTSKTLQDTQAQLTDANNSIKNYRDTIYKIGTEKMVLMLRAAFAPEKLRDEMRLLFFDDYDEHYKAAKANGII